MEYILECSPTHLRLIKGIIQKQRDGSLTFNMQQMVYVMTEQLIDRSATLSCHSKILLVGRESATVTCLLFSGTTKLNNRIVENLSRKTRN